MRWVVRRGRQGAGGRFSLGLNGVGRAIWFAVVVVGMRRCARRWNRRVVRARRRRGGATVLGWVGLVVVWPCIVWELGCN